MVATAMYATAPPSFSPKQHKLRTYIVLNAKSSRGRLASFTDSLDETLSTTSTASPSSSPSSSPATSPLRATRKSLAALQPEPLIPDECLAYESYAAVASRFQPTPSSSSPTRDLRWSDISRPRLHLATLTPHATIAPSKPLSQKERRRQLQRARSVSNGGSPNDHLECHALELCFEFLDLADLQRATAVCTEFRDVVRSAGRLFVAIYARAWRTGLAAPTPRMPRAYAQLGFAPALQMVQQRRGDVDYPLTTRSLVTKRADATYEILNNSLLRVLTRGAVDSTRGVHALPVQSCANALGVDVRYFEVAMSGCGSVGVVSLSDVKTRLSYGYGSDEHVGWKGVSCGYHGNDGDFVFNNGAAPYGGEWTPYGPSWGVRTIAANGDEMPVAAATSTVGCGLDMATRRVFFTLNGTFLGFCKFTVPEGEYAAAVSLHEFNDRAVMNAGSAPFSFDLEGFCASL